MIWVPHSRAEIDLLENFKTKILSLHGHNIKMESVKYLGYFLDSHLKWRQHVINVNDKIAKGLCMLRLCKSFLPRNCLLNKYYAFVYPRLIYGVEYWGCAAKTVLHGIKIFQNKCIRVLRNADFYAHVPPLAKSTNIIQYLIICINIVYLILCAKFILNFAVLHCLTCLRKLTFLTITVLEMLITNFISSLVVLMFASCLFLIMVLLCGII